MAACLDMYNSEHKNNCHAPPMSPRISFSNDFAESHCFQKQEVRRDNVPASSSDFEFSVSNYSMMSADELFFKGKLLPFKETSSNQKTLREELLVEDDDDDVFRMRPPKGGSGGGSQRWKGFLGLRKPHIGSKKVEKISEEKITHDTKSSTNKELLNEGGSSCRDVEIGI